MKSKYHMFDSTFVALTCHVPCFTRCWSGKGKRSMKRFKNQHAKAQRFFNKFGYKEFCRVYENRLNS